MNGLPTRARLAFLHALLWAGPLAITLSIVILFSNRSAFRYGHEVPSAGDPRAWTAMWVSLLLTGAGVITGLVANLTWLALALRRGRAIRIGAWVRAGIAGALAAAVLALWLNP